MSTISQISFYQLPALGYAIEVEPWETITQIIGQSMRMISTTCKVF